MSITTEDMIVIITLILVYLENDNNSAMVGMIITILSLKPHEFKFTFTVRLAL